LTTGRPKAFRVIATIMVVAGVAFGLVTAVGGIVSEEEKVHGIHNAVVAGLLVVLTAPPLIAAARRPERSAGPLLHLAVVGVAGLATMALGLAVDLFTLPVIVLVGVLWWLRPTRESPIPPGRVSPILLLLVLVAAVPLVVYALGQAELQRIDSSSEHAERFHWVETSFYATAILLLGLLAALRPAAYRMTAWIAAIALAVLGVASLALRNYPSALEADWAWAAVAGSVLFVAIAEWEARRASHSPAG
jgi:uncharacterized membrane protein (UPF0136 family)